jgi:hypothetical protein
MGRFANGGEQVVGSRCVAGAKTLGAEREAVALVEKDAGSPVDEGGTAVRVTQNSAVLKPFDRSRQRIGPLLQRAKPLLQKHRRGQMRQQPLQPGDFVIFEGSAIARTTYGKVKGKDREHPAE